MEVGSIIYSYLCPGFGLCHLNPPATWGGGYHPHLMESVGACSEVHGLPWWLSGKESTCNAGDVGLIPGLGRSKSGFRLVKSSHTGLGTSVLLSFPGSFQKLVGMTLFPLEQASPTSRI